MMQSILSFISDEKNTKDQNYFEAINYIKMVEQTVLIFNTDDFVFNLEKDKRFKSISYKLTPTIKGHKIYVANKREKTFNEVIKEILPENKNRLIIINGEIDNEIFNFIIDFKEKNNLDFIFNNKSIFVKNEYDYFNPEKRNISAFSILNSKVLNESDFNILRENLYDLDALGIFITCELSRLHFEKHLQIKKENKTTKQYSTPIYYYNNNISVNYHVFENFIDTILKENVFIKFTVDEIKKLFEIDESN